MPLYPQRFYAKGRPCTQPETRQEVEEWLIRAERDLLAAARALDGPLVLGEVTAYHSQQAGEKALKGFLVAHERIFGKTHDLLTLVNLCASIDEEFGNLRDSARVLTPYVMQFRYPGGPLEPSVPEARRALQLATEIVQFVRSRLPLGG